MVQFCLIFGSIIAKISRICTENFYFPCKYDIIGKIHDFYEPEVTFRGKMTGSHSGSE